MLKTLPSFSSSCCSSSSIVVRNGRFRPSYVLQLFLLDYFNTRSSRALLADCHETLSYDGKYVNFIFCVVVVVIVVVGVVVVVVWP